MLRGGDRGFPVDRQRSVFVGNISYDVSEEQLRDVFSKAGTVVHLRLVHDRETGKPKGYGFAEFSDVKSAELAIRNLNGHELNGRALRVDSAAGDQNRMGPDAEHGNIVVMQPEESPYGKECDPKDAPEIISRNVASIPPEKMFHLMKQMKEIVSSNPSEAKNMLLQNPQLAYALLQAQVVMRIVDPQQPMASGSTPFHAPVAPPQQQQQQMPPPMQQQTHFGGRPMPPLPSVAPPGGGGPSSYHGGMPPPPQAMGGGGFAPPPQFGAPPPGYGAPPPGYGRPQQMQPPPIQQPPQQPPGGYSDAERDNASLLLQVMNLTEEELMQLPAEDREKILTLRTKLRNA
ncbi:cpf-2 [Pristionchus pacificus]|uniref:Cpf-2 n=1 Tax=Pristionchus pacificus TaxID=54126 RepID=A0A454Y6Q7_PRIPA|nr:cpf-2 [Pristionchus pacificus]|eukprot:PDM60944.1 cpf-2 [Pristionchus pacificus]